MKAPIESVRVRVSLFVAAIALSALPTRSFGLAETNDFYGLPAGLANDVVRIDETFPGNGPGNGADGSGTIISTVPDGSGGYWYNVLTADHVVYDAYNAGTNANPWSITMGFVGNPTPAFNQLPLGVASTNNVAVDGANGPGGRGPDLALFAIDVTAAQMAQTNVIAPGGLLPVTFSSPNNAAGNLIVQAGYGTQATAGIGGPAPAGVNRYLWTNNLGTYDAGANTIPSTGLVSNLVTPFNSARGTPYMNDAIQTTFQLTTSGATVLSGTTAILPGDSGGPTFGTNGFGGFSLVGVHSWGSFYTNNLGQTWTQQGQLSADVQISSYTNWIATEIPLIDVPEPSSLAMAGAGLLLLAGFWSRAKGRRGARTNGRS
ncbi:MAG: PEP-CTERM sorting domain-containing protein [Verrucomicrobiia bacterium]|jgi:hypothetical protein